ncbi:hypothetical protein [Metabacillus halosaccharovorans]|uniref:hypothetical protein n=1 Tax=Metabacillus halosaccharovorans TaxID=930124 RepID=UPI001C1FD22C|nr:hypothetical protein [Metabacillus halosaccharovorans]MBU7595929.1 hypothetical protein [Metabacillus halosaccharovorans]MCM3444493.1 hypothetical protein [Metabacillus halosaccharovorans]
MCGPITKEDKDLAAEFIYLTLLLEHMESDMELFNKIPVKLNDPYVTFMDSIIKVVLKDLVLVKRKMKEKQIKVLDPVNVNEDFMQYEYYVRGYNTVFRFFKPVLKNRVSDRAEKYFIGNKK